MLLFLIHQGGFLLQIRRQSNMKLAVSQGWLHHRFDPPQLMWLMLATYLLVDTIGGFFSQQLGIELRLSQLFKVFIIFLGFYNLLRWRSQFTSMLLLTFLLLLVGPVCRLLTASSLTFVQFDLAFTTRILMLLVVLAYCLECARQESELFLRWSARSLVWGFWIVVGNVLLGFVGLGFPTYPDTGVGFKGFFVAGNEVSAVFVLLTAFMTQIVWNQSSKPIYVLFSILILVIGAAIATKAGILFAIMAVVLIPVINLRSALLSPRALMLFSGLLCLLVFALFNLFSWIETLPQYSQLASNFASKGILGFVLSGREDFIRIYWDSIHDMRGLTPLLLGDSAAGFIKWAGKETAEVDPIDISMYFGLPFAVVFICLSMYSVWLPLKRLNTHLYAPAVLLANVGLFGFAVIAGHVWTSGMLGIGWAILNSLISIPLVGKLRSQEP